MLPSIGAPSLSSYLPARLNSSTQPITPVQPKKMKEPMPVSRANRSSTYAAALEACGGNQLYDHVAISLAMARLIAIAMLMTTMEPMLGPFLGAVLVMAMPPADRRQRPATGLR